ncbi:phage antirepressor KilAC domain-containing protein [Salininema proteolyticum]|uniref:Phage antirepressor KilAC domain-containing protein n=1 Tax=Salininema proteolyticum TaxID=1607685 RepID=A0ABV8TUH8_9ACTN
MDETQAAGIARYNPFDELRRVDRNGEDFWSARDLQAAAGYSSWQKFTDAIDRAAASLANMGVSPGGHIRYRRRERKQTVGFGTRTTQFEDVELTRTGAYAVFMNGDPRKAEVAMAQGYFNIMTQTAEKLSRKLPDTFAEALRELADEHEQRLVAESRARELEPKAIAYDKWLSTDGLARFRDAVRMLKEVYGPQVKEALVKAHLRKWGLVEQYGNAATAKALNAGWMHNRAGTKTSGSAWVQGLFTKKGLEYLCKKYSGAGDARSGFVPDGATDLVFSHRKENA